MSQSKTMSDEGSPAAIQQSRELLEVSIGEGRATSYKLLDLHYLHNALMALYIRDLACLTTLERVFVRQARARPTSPI